MQSRSRSILTVATTLAAVACAAAMAAGNAYAEGPLVDTPAFQGARTRAEVKAEVLAHQPMLTAAGTEWYLQRTEHAQGTGGASRADVRAEYLAARQETAALTAEDSGSSYLARAMGLARPTAIAATLAR